MLHWILNYFTFHQNGSPTNGNFEQATKSPFARQSSRTVSFRVITCNHTHTCTHRLMYLTWYQLLGYQVWVICLYCSYFHYAPREHPDSAADVWMTVRFVNSCVPGFSTDDPEEGRGRFTTTEEVRKHAGLWFLIVYIDLSRIANCYCLCCSASVRMATKKFESNTVRK